LQKKIDSTHDFAENKNVFDFISCNIRLNLKEARLDKLIVYQRSYLRNWVNKNITNDSDITIERIKDFYKEIRKELKWNLVSSEVKTMPLYCFGNTDVFSNRSATPTPLQEKIF